MINLYRLVHYPNETLVLFQGDSTDLEQISQILHFKPFEAKKDYETGHGAYLRGKWREKSEREILHYLQSHYRPLPLELSIFTTDGPFPEPAVKQSGNTLLPITSTNILRGRNIYLIKSMDNQQYTGVSQVCALMNLKLMKELVLSWTLHQSINLF